MRIPDHTNPAPDRSAIPGVWAVVPLKPFELAKQRLAEVLSHTERQQLMQAMVRDVVAALQTARGIDGIVLVSRSGEAAELAQELGVEHWQESRQADLSGAVSEASRWLVKTHQARATLIIPGDVPLVSPEEIESLLTHCDSGATSLVLVPDQNGAGTNSILSCPPDLIPYRYDGRSFKPHLSVARGRGLKPITLTRPGIGLDIDLPEDLSELITRLASEKRNAAATRAFLESSGVASRVRRLHNGQPASLRAS